MGLPCSVTDYPLFAGKHLTSEFRKAQRGAISGEITSVPEYYLQKRTKLTAKEWSNTFGDRMHGAARLR